MIEAAGGAKPVTLIKFHRVLIVSFILLCGFLGETLWRRYQDQGGALLLTAALFFVVLGVGFGFYLRTVGRRSSPR